jgi:2-oxoglutarate dehydrogenase E2 component (dihydrolipoamide succinyltransferase)
MAYKLKVPQMGESVVEGTIGKWLVKVGDEIKKDQPIVGILTDKVNVEVPAERDGVILEILAAVDDIVPIGKEIAVIGERGEKPEAAEEPEPRKAEAKPAEKEAAAEKPAPKPEPKEEKPKQKPAEPGKPQRLSPAVRRLIREHDLDVSQIEGSGAEGRVTVKDVESYLETAGEPEAKPAAPAPSPESTPAPGKRVEEIPIPRVRGLIAQHMVRSKQTSPHVTTFDECDFSRLVDFRRRHVDRIEQETGIRVTYMPFIVKAACLALKEFPYMNASLTEDKIILRHYYNIGMAVARDQGLIVPVIRDADQKSVLELSRAMKDLGDRARSEKLRPEDIEGGTFSITNAGVYGALNSTPIISQPQVGILGVHAIQKRPVVRDDEIVIRDMMNFGLSFDHRLVDGHYAVQFLRQLITYLEDPEFMLL